MQEPTPRRLKDKLSCPICQSKNLDFEATTKAWNDDSDNILIVMGHCNDCDAIIEHTFNLDYRYTRTWKE